MDRQLVELAHRTRGFMPEAEGLALRRAVLELGVPGPVLEVGGYCGLSALYLGDGARARGRLVFSVDHHHGSEENQAGWVHHDPALVDPRTGRIDTLPHFRRTILDAGLEETVVAVVGESTAVAAAWRTPLAMLFVDGGHGEPVAMADYGAWEGLVAAGGVLAIHDVFADPAEGGQGPFWVYRRALADGFVEGWAEGSLRLLRR
jgi:predicted O-methyltransferase YrrM